MKYKISFYRKVASFALLLLLSISSHIFTKECIDLTRGIPVVSMLHSMAPAHQIIDNGETVIDQEGSYHLLENIQGNIIVNASKVSIDLNGFTISSDAVDTVTLITIGPDVTDIVIKNGALAGNCSNNGIILEQPLAGIQGTIKRIFLEDLRISNIDTGIILSGENTTLECCKITDCRISNCTVGIDMFQANKNILKDVEVCCFTKDAFKVVNCEYNKFEQCKAIRGGNSITDDNSSNSGFYVTAGTDNLFYECFGEAICKEGALFCTKTAGFYFGFDVVGTDTLGEKESKIINCCVDSITSSSYGNAVGVYLESRLLDDATNIAYGTFPEDPAYAFNDVAWSPGCGFIALADEESIGSVKVVKFDGTELSGPVTSIAGSFYIKVAWSANGRYLIGLQSILNRINLKDLRTGKTFVYSDTEVLGDDQLTDITWFNKSLSFIATGTVREYKFIFEDEAIHLLKYQNDELADQGVRSVAVTPDDCFVAKAVQSKGTLGNIVVYDSDDLSRIVSTVASTGLAVNDIDWNPIACCARRYLAAVGETDGTSNIEIFEFEGTTIGSIETAEFDRVLHSIKWSPRGKDFLVTSTDHNVGVFTFDPSAAAGSRVTEVFSYATAIGNDTAQSPIYADWSPCGNYIVIAGATGTVEATSYNVEVIKVGETVENNVVEGCRIANICGGLCGLGIWGCGCKNLIDDNVVCCSGVPYSSGVYARYLGGLLGTAGYLENLYGNDYCVCCPCVCEARVCDCGCIECSIVDEPVV